MSDTQSFTKMVNQLATSFKENLEGIEKQVPNIEDEILKGLNFLPDDSSEDSNENLGKIKSTLNDFFDELDLEDLFEQIDLKEQIKPLVVELNKMIDKLGLKITDFSPDPFALLSTIPDLLPENLLKDFPNVKPQIKELVNMISSQGVSLKFKKVTASVPPILPKTSSNIGSGISDSPPVFSSNSEEGASPIEALEVFLNELIEGKDEIFNELLKEIETKINESGFILELDEKIAPLQKQLTSGEFSFSSLLEELAKLVQELGSSALALVRGLLVDVLLGEKVLKLVKEIIEKKASGLTEEVLKTLMPSHEDFKLLSIPALLVATPLTLFAKPSTRGITARTGRSNVVSFRNESRPPRSFTRSPALYGIVQLFKGLLSLGELIKLRKNPKVKHQIGALVLDNAIASTDILANLFAQISSSADATEAEGQKDRHILYVLWVYQWVSALIWPFITLLLLIFTKKNKKNQLSVQFITGALTIVIEGIHLILFAIANDKAGSSLTIKVANIIDAFPGILGGLVTIFTTDLNVKNLSTDERIAEINHYLGKLQSSNLKTVYTEFKEDGANLKKSLEVDLKPAINQLKTFYIHRIEGNNDRQKLFKYKLIVRKIKEVEKAINGVLSSSLLTRDSKGHWNSKTKELSEIIATLKEKLDAKKIKEAETLFRQFESLQNYFLEKQKRFKTIEVLEKKLDTLINQLPRQSIDKVAEPLKGDFHQAKDQLKNKRRIIIGLTPKMNKVLFELNDSSTNLLKIIRHLKPAFSKKASKEKKTLAVESGLNVLTFLLQLVYSFLILVDEYPPDSQG